MITLLIVIAIITLVQSFALGISLAMLVMWVSRLLFVGRLFGMKSKMSALVTLELFAIGFSIVLPLAFGGKLVLYKVLLNVFSTLLFLAVEVYDDTVNIYYEKDI